MTNVQMTFGRGTILTLLLLALLTPASCRREEEAFPGTAEATDTTATQPTAEVPPAVSVNLSEYRIEMPASIPAGPTTFLVTNNGKENHSFEVEGQGIEKELEKELEPGESATFEVDLTAGTYKVYCPVKDHAKRGMTLQLAVQ